MGAIPDPDLCDLLNQMLRYNPHKRISLIKAMAHPYFDELRDERTYLPTGNCLPDIFMFTEKELNDMGGEMRDLIIPQWYDPVTSPKYHIVDYNTLKLYDDLGNEEESPLSKYQGN